MDHHPTFESTLVNQLITQGSTFAIAFLFLILQYTFKLDFKCPCNTFDNHVFCGLYVLFPFFGLFLILTLTAKTCTVVCSRCCMNIHKFFCYLCCSCEGCPDASTYQTFNCAESCSCPSCSCECFCKMWRWFYWKNITRNLFLSLLWIVTVLIDGDVLVCWNLTKDNITHWYDQIPCRENNNLTAEESTTKKYYHALSQVIGLALLFSAPVVWLCMSMFCQQPYYKSAFQNVYEEETMESAEKEMRDRVSENAKKKIRKILNEGTEDDWYTVSEKINKFIRKEDTELLTEPSLFNPTPPRRTQSLPQLNQRPPQANWNPSRQNQVLKSKYFSAKPKPYSAKSRHSLAKPKRTTAKSKPYSAQPESSSAQPEP